MVNKRNLEVIGSVTTLALAYVIFFRDVLTFRSLIAGIDFQIPLTSAGSYWDQVFESWSQSQLGSPASQLGSRSYNFLFSGLLIVFASGDQIIAQKLWFCGLFVASMVMYAFSKNHLTNSNVVSVGVGILYAYSPSVSLNYGTGLIWEIAFFPAAMNYLFNLLGSKARVRDSLLFAVTLTLTVTFGGHMMLWMFLFGAILLLGNLMIAIRRWKFLSRTFAYGLLGLFLFAIMNPSIISVSLSLVAPGTTSSGTTLVSLPTIGNFYSNYEPLTTLTLLTSSYGVHVTFGTWLGFVLPIVAFSALLLVQTVRKRIQTLAFSAVFVIAIFFVMSVRNRWPFLPVLYPSIPFLGILRGTQSVSFLLDFVLASLCALTIDELLRRSHGHLLGIRVPLVFRRGLTFPKSISFPRAYFLLLLVLTAQLLLNPVYNPLVHAYGVGYPNQSGLPTAYPSVYETLYQWMRTDPEFGVFRYAFVPAPYTAYQFLPLEYPSALAPTQGSLATNNYLTQVNDALLRNQTIRWGATLAPVSVKYIFVVYNTQEPSSVQFTKGPPGVNFDYTLGGDISSFTSFLSRQRDLETVLSTSDYTIYRNSDYLSRIIALPHLIVAFGNVELLSTLASLPELSPGQNAVVFPTSMAQNEESFRLASWVVLQNYDAAGVSSLPAYLASTPILIVYDKEPYLAGQLLFASLSQKGGSLVVRIFNPSASKDTVGVTGNIFDANVSRELLTFTTPRLLPGQIWERSFDLSYQANNTRLYITDAAGRQISGMLTWRNNSTSSVDFGRFYAGHFSTPKAGNYLLRFTFESNAGTIPITIAFNHTTLDYNATLNGELYDGPSLPLEQGIQKVNFTTPLSNGLKSVILYPWDAMHRKPLSTYNTQIVTSSARNSRYVVNVNTTGPFFLTLGESYSSRWSASVNGNKLDHFTAYSVVNGFYVNQMGRFDIVIEYDDQGYSTITSVGVATFLASLTVPIVGQSFLWRSPGRKLRISSVRKAASRTSGK